MSGAGEWINEWHHQQGTVGGGPPLAPDSVKPIFRTATAKSHARCRGGITELAVSQLQCVRTFQLARAPPVRAESYPGKLAPCFSVPVSGQPPEGSLDTLPECPFPHLWVTTVFPPDSVVVTSVTVVTVREALSVVPVLQQTLHSW